MKVGDQVQVKLDAYYDGSEERFTGGLMKEWRGETGVVVSTHERPWGRFNGRPFAVVRLDSLIHDRTKVPTLDHWPVAAVWADQLLPLDADHG